MNLALKSRPVRESLKKHLIHNSWKEILNVSLTIRSRLDSR